MKRNAFRLLIAVSLLLSSVLLTSCSPVGPYVGIAIAALSGGKSSDDGVGAVRITSGPNLTGLTNSSVTVQWTTDLQSDSTVDYGPDTAYGSQEFDSALDTMHSITLTGLASNTAYHYRATSIAASGAAGTSADKQFTTKVALVVSSAYGPTTPDTGTHYYDSAEDVFTSAPGTVDGPAKTRYRCTGYSGTGSAPASGTGSSAYFSITQDSTLTWNWVTQYYLTTSTNPIGSGTISCSPLGNWHDDGTAPEVTATGNAGYAFVNWTGDLTGSTNPDSVTMDAPKTVVANFTGETFNLTVASAWGSPDPGVGVHFCASGANIDASVDSPVSGGAGVRYVCTGWSGTGDVPATGGASSVNFTITQDSTITWNWKTQYQLTTVIDPVGGGTVSRSPDATWYDNSTVVGLTAAPEATFSFNNWTGDPVVNPDTPATPETVEITMDSPKTVTANFSGGGTFWDLTVTSTYGTPDPPVGVNSVAQGTTVTATVDTPVDGAPGTRYACTGWTGTGDVPSTGSTNSTNFTMTQDSSITWNWKTQYQLTTSVTPVGGGSIGRSPDASWYDENTDVDLLASPNASYVFDSWSGDLTGSVNPDTVTMNAPKSVTATFITTTYTLTVASAYGSPDPPVGNNIYTSGTDVTALVPSPVAGPAGTRYVCTGWSGAGSVPSSGTTNSVVFAILEDSSITWNWKTQYELAVTLSPPGGGTVDLVPPGGWYDPPTSVQLTVNPDASYNFTGWSGDLTGSTNPENLTVDAPKSVTANFELKPLTILVPTDYLTIQAAIDACVAGGTVLVADGTWTGLGNKDLDFGGKDITVKSENGPENCIIDCEDSGRGFYFHSGETLAAIIDGFTITNGDIGSNHGGGVFCYSSSSPTFTNCTISGNAATSYGGGVYCRNSSNPAFISCTISGNTADDGGGVRCYSSSPTFTNCNISGNTSEHGGGVQCYSSNPVFTNCIISVNTATTLGGGVYCYSSSSPTFANCAISNNTAYSGGGAYCSGGSPVFTNCTISNNTITSGGGGVFCYYSNPTFTNCTISGNTADDGGGVHCYSSNPTFENSIIWGNTAPNGNEIYTSDAGSTVTFNYCDYTNGSGDVEGDGTVTPSNCLNLDPLFVNSTAQDYRLNGGSPCIDAGNNSLVPPGVTTDLDGNKRIVKGVVDIGAYEMIYYINHVMLALNGDMPIGDTDNYYGRVHVNEIMRFRNRIPGLGAHFYNQVTCCNDPMDYGEIGGTAEAWYSVPPVWNAEAVPSPVTTLFADYRAVAESGSGSWTNMGPGADAASVWVGENGISILPLAEFGSIELHFSKAWSVADGTHQEVDILVWDSGAALDTLTVDVPADTVICSQVEIDGIQGEIYSRITVTCETGHVKISDDIEYEDEDGNHPYEYDSFNPEDPNNFTPNYDYSGSACLGVIAKKDVLLANQNGDLDLVVHGTFACGHGDPVADGAFRWLDTTEPDWNELNRDLRVFGAIISDGVQMSFGMTVSFFKQYTSGGAHAGGYSNVIFVYDNYLSTSPPPYFLER